MEGLRESLARMISTMPNAFTTPPSHRMWGRNLTLLLRGTHPSARDILEDGQASQLYDHTMDAELHDLILSALPGGILLERLTGPW